MGNSIQTWSTFAKRLGHGQSGPEWMGWNRFPEIHQKGNDFCSSLYVNQNQLDEFVESEIKEMFLTDKGKQEILSIIQNQYLKDVAHLGTMIGSLFPYSGMRFIMMNHVL